MQHLKFEKLAGIFAFLIGTEIAKLFAAGIFLLEDFHGHILEATVTFSIHFMSCPKKFDEEKRWKKRLVIKKTSRYTNNDQGLIF